jgi:hypothetical protein
MSSTVWVWESSNPRNMAEYITNAGIALDLGEQRLVARAFEGGHCWSVQQMHELNVLCFEARGWMRRGDYESAFRG